MRTLGDSAAGRNVDGLQRDGKDNDPFPPPTPGDNLWLRLLVHKTF